MKLSKETKALLARVIGYTDEALLSWAGYDTKQQWEDDHDEKFSRPALIEYNFEDIEYMVDYYEEEEQKKANRTVESSSKIKKHGRTWT